MTIPLANTRTIKAAAVALALFASACGGKASSGQGPVINVDAPTPGPRQAAVSTLEPIPTPSPTPVPTPAPPTPTPMSPPRSASMTARTGSQTGSPSSYCWTAGDKGACRDYPAASQPGALEVRRGEAVTLRLDADAPPDGESIRPFQGPSRTGYPSTKIDPAMQTSLTIDLDPGEWNMDLCATWTGHGQPCWLFRLTVVQ